MTQSHNQQQFAISEVAADWRELVVVQHIMRIAAIHSALSDGQLD